MNQPDSSASRRHRLATSMVLSAMAGAAGSFAMLRPPKDSGAGKATRTTPAPAPTSLQRQRT